jgi:hypothetical protein
VQAEDDARLHLLPGDDEALHARRVVWCDAEIPTPPAVNETLTADES